MTGSLLYFNTLVLTVLITFEFILEQKEHKHIYKQKDTFQSILIGLGLFVCSFINRVLILGSFYFLYRFRILIFGNSWTTWLIAFLLTDLSYYWYHRSAHSINWLWAAHSVHHSSEQFNITVSLRQSWVNQLSGEFLFWIWLPFLGFHPLMIYILFQICGLYQSWLHTELIGKLHPLFEYLFNTPSHHRVHHGTNLNYLDKNNGAVIILWDRLFGTYQEEEEKPIYGLTKKIASNDLFHILCSDWIYLFSKVASSKSIRIAINYFIQPPGWSHDGSTKTVKQLRRLPKE